MKTRSILVIGAAIGLFSLTPTTSVRAEARSLSAIQQLEKAKVSGDPAAHLEQAKDYLQTATEHLRAEELTEAIQAVDYALVDVHRRDRHNMLKHIEFAIHEIYDARH